LWSRDGLTLTLADLLWMKAVDQNHRVAL
jgi:hypothetical protein